MKKQIRSFFRLSIYSYNKSQNLYILYIIFVFLFINFVSINFDKTLCMYIRATFYVYNFPKFRKDMF